MWPECQRPTPTGCRHDPFAGVARDVNGLAGHLRAEAAAALLMMLDLLSPRSTAGSVPSWGADRPAEALLATDRTTPGARAGQTAARARSSTS